MMFQLSGFYFRFLVRLKLRLQLWDGLGFRHFLRLSVRLAVLNRSGEVDVEAMKGFHSSVEALNFLKLRP